MPRFTIERNIPGAGKLSDDELTSISQKSCDVLRIMGPHIQWVQSYVTGDKIYCIYIAPNEDSIREHAAKGGFPADVVVVAPIKTIVGFHYRRGPKVFR